MPIFGPLFNCFHRDSGLQGKEFETLFLVDSRTSFYSKTGYLPTWESKGVAGCIDSTGKELVLLLDSDDLVRNAKQMMKCLVRNNVRCHRLRFVDIPSETTKSTLRKFASLILEEEE